MAVFLDKSDNIHNFIHIEYKIWIKNMKKLKKSSYPQSNKSELKEWLLIFRGHLIFFMTSAIVGKVNNLQGDKSMNNNDILIRLRYALDIKNVDMVEIFKLGGVEVTKDEVLKILTKINEEEEDNEDVIICDDQMFDAFLNGFIIFKRGKQDPKPGQPERQAPSLKESSNNLLLKKLKIALSLTSEDMLQILEDAGVRITKGELSALLRKVGHKNYKFCGDRYARNFLKGLAIRYRG
jgi:uncharacterized protein YehS (DUF1456 family)